MTPTSATWRMADQLCDGKLAKQLLRLSKQGKGTRAIADELYATSGVLVSHATVGNWLAIINRPERAEVAR